MIEFKALCGHVLRARDEDAGRGVRCSHCGRVATVPVRLGSDSLKMMMEEIEESAAVGAARAIRPSHSIFARLIARWRAAKPGAFDPFALVLKLCYGLGLFVILYVVVVRALPAWREDSAARSALHPPGTGDGAATSLSQATPSQRTRGLHGSDRRLRGIFVSTVPSSARAYCLDASRASDAGSIARHPDARPPRLDGICTTASDSAVVVDVALAWNDPTLSRYPGYWELRRAAEAASGAAQEELLSRYFLPDEAAKVFLDVTDEQTYFVRRFRAEARGDQLKAIHAMFLPRLARAGGAGFSLDAVVRDFLPKERRYGFDEDSVRNELAYYGVLDAERPVVIDALGRVGAIPCALPDGHVRLFKIGVNDGQFATKLLE